MQGVILSGDGSNVHSNADVQELLRDPFIRKALKMGMKNGKVEEADDDDDDGGSFKTRIFVQDYSKSSKHGGGGGGAGGAGGAGGSGKKPPGGGKGKNGSKGSRKS